MLRPRFSLLSLVLFSLLTGSILSLIKNAPSWRAWPLNFSQLKDAEFSSDDKYLIAISGNMFDRYVTVWDTATGQKVFTSTEPWRDAMAVPVLRSMTDGTRLLVDRRSNSILFDWAQNKVEEPFEAGTHAHYRHGYFILKNELKNQTWLAPYDNPAKKLVVESAREYEILLTDPHCALLRKTDGRTRLYELPSGMLRKQFFSNPASSSTAKATADGRYVLLTQNRSMKFLSFQDDSFEKELHGHTSTILDTLFTPDGKLISAGNDNMLRLWDPVSGTALRIKEVVPGYDVPAQRLKLSPDGKTFATLNYPEQLASKKYQHRAFVWNTQDFTRLHEFPFGVHSTHFRNNQWLAFHHNGRIYRAGNESPVYTVPFKPHGFETIVQVSPSGTSFLAKDASWNFHLLTNQRPEPWWGVAWIPTFWTTLILAILFLWNLFRRTK